MSESTVLLAAAALSALLTMLTAVLVQIVIPDMAIRVYMAGSVRAWHSHRSAVYRIAGGLFRHGMFTITGLLRTSTSTFRGRPALHALARACT